ncbi:TPA: UvrD-helicase domain-containing protein [Acinetobacter baumannii]
MINITDADIDLLEIEMSLKFDSSRREALKNFIDVQACPGGGKTTLIAAKLILLAKKWNSPYKGICVISHTNVAKDEIIARLEKHEHGRTILSYPHFIGTIQEFINRYLAIPYCRQNNISVNQVDDEVCTKILSFNITRGTTAYLDRHHAKISDLQVKFINNKLSLNIPGFTKKSESSSYINLVNAKKVLIDKGLFFYREMFEFASANMYENAETALSIRKRFPIVFIDEMQDTYEYQDDILSIIFNQDSNLQRFGDPDQSIFESSNEPLNTSYNGGNHHNITDSNRFNQTIANLSSGLSYNRLSLTSAITSNFQNTIFLIDSASQHKAINAFANLCSNQLTDFKTDPIKIVGAIGTKKDTNISLVNYFPKFNKCNSSSNYRPERIIYCFKRDNINKNWHSKEIYKSVLEGICYYAKINNKKIPIDTKEQEFSINSIKKYLKKESKLKDFNKLFISILRVENLNQEFWDSSISQMLQIFNLNGLSKIPEYINYDGRTASAQSNNENCEQNKISIEINNKNIEMEVATIHSIKGETHAATLVVETTFGRSHDISNVFTYLVHQQPSEPKPQTIKFMKQIYVAMTRPRHFVCLAVHKKNINQHLSLAEQKGWKIIDLTVT